MNKLRLWLLAVVAGVVLVGCLPGQETETTPVAYGLDVAFALAGGQAVTIGGENVTLRFDEVLEDSRCPTQVNCVWTGQARIAVAVQVGGGEAVTVEFNTNPAPDQNVQTAEVEGYTIELLGLEPYPETIEEGIAFEDYQATLMVRKGGGDTAAAFNLDEPFTLNGGAAATLNGDALTVQFDEVLEDSRCPRQVQCVEAGQARIALVVQAGTEAPVRVAFNTNLAPTMNVQTAEVGGYGIELVSLEPYPETAGEIPLADYRATLVVRKGDGGAAGSFKLDEPFTLNGGQEATLSGENVRVRFAAMLEESRCPTQVTCVWAGQARIALTVQTGEGEPVTVELNSNGQVGETTAEVGGYRIELQALTPQPERPDVAIPFEAYQATLLVTKGSTPSTETVEAKLEEKFTLYGGQAAVIVGENVTVRFAEVWEDSRCPRQVECEWAGQVRVALEVRQGEAEPIRVELNTYPYAGQQTAEVGPYTIQLRSVDPYPETAGETIGFEAYWVSLVVWKETAVAYGLGETFTVGGGEEVVIIGENLGLRFEAVLEDSRCPREVECFWSGQARIALVVQAGEDEPVEVELNSTVEEERTAEVAGYRIELLLVGPERVRPEDVIGFEEYRVTLVVTRE